MSSKISLNLPKGRKMPALGLGTWQAKDESELTSALNAALEAGYRHIDTAYLYDNEKIIGQVLKEWFTSGKIKREDLFITTKLPAQGVHPDRVEFFLNRSLENLQLDYVDLYLIHFPVASEMDENTKGPKFDADRNMVFIPKSDHVGVWKKMEEQVAAGRIKSIGLSNFSISQIENVLKNAKIKPANLQIEVHLFLQQKKLVNFCHKKGITVVAYSPLGCPGYNKLLTAMGREARTLPDILGNSVISKIGKKHNKSPAQIALRFLLQRGLGVIPKSVTPKRILENISVFDFELDLDDMNELFALEVGEEARVVNFRMLKGITEHPDFPLK